MGATTADEAPSTTPDSSPPSYSAFFYGTLMAPEVFFTVCYRNARPPASLTKDYTFRPAVLSNHSRRRVIGDDYPGVTPQEGHTVLGILATGLTETNVWRLDYFEGGEYTREKHKVKLQGGEDDGKEVEAWVYIFNNPPRLEDREWDFEGFRREKMKNWTRGAGEIAFNGCDPDDPATVKESDESK